MVATRLKSRNHVLFDGKVGHRSMSRIERLGLQLRRR
jgi:hypothetical protein